MNNKSDKKHKRKQKQKKPKTKKKTASSQSKKKTKIKSGGMWPFSKNKMTQLKEPLLPNSKAIPNPQQSASSNPQQLVSSNAQQVVSSNPQQLVSSNLKQSTSSNAQQVVSSNPQQLVSSNGSYNPTTKTPSNQQNWKNKTKLAELQQSFLSNSKRLANAQSVNSRNPQQNVVSQPPPPPKAQPQGFNTLKAQSRCSIM